MRFERVPFDEFRRHFTDDDNGYESAVKAYEQIKLPQRGTPGSAGYDFYLPMDVRFAGAGYVSKFPTGICAILDPGYVLLLVPRSSLGFKYGMSLINTVGVIDEDFINGDSGGHIMAAFKTDSAVKLKAGDRYMQGIIVKYGMTEDDCPLNEQRTGGIGSTGGQP